MIQFIYFRGDSISIRKLEDISNITYLGVNQITDCWAGKLFRFPTCVQKKYSLYYIGYILYGCDKVENLFSGFYRCSKTLRIQKPTSGLTFSPQIRLTCLFPSISGIIALAVKSWKVNSPKSGISSLRTGTWWSLGWFQSLLR